MGCGCLIALFALISPRFALFLVWAFTDRLDVISSFWMGLAGFVFLPWTTLAYAAAYEPIQGVSGLGLALVAFAFLVDIATWFNGGKARADQRLT